MSNTPITWFIDLVGVSEDVFEIEANLKILSNKYKQTTKFLQSLILQTQKEDVFLEHYQKRFGKNITTSYLREPLINAASSIKKELTNQIKSYVRNHPVFDAFFKRIKGIGEIYAGLMLGEIPARRFRTCANLWKFAGWAPPSQYNGKKTYNMWVKKITWTAVRNIIMKRGKYYEYFNKWHLEELEKLEFKKNNIFEKWKEKKLEEINNLYEEKKISYDIKKSLENTVKAATPPKSKGHAYIRAVRKIAKMFLAHFHEAYWKTFDKEPVKPYFILIGLKDLYIPFENLLD